MVEGWLYLEWLVMWLIGVVVRSCWCWAVVVCCWIDGSVFGLVDRQWSCVG